MTFLFAIVVARPGGIFSFLKVKTATALQRRQQDNETSFHLDNAAIRLIQASEIDEKIGKRFSHAALAIERSSDSFSRRMLAA